MTRAEGRSAKSRREAAKTIAWGLAWVIGALSFLLTGLSLTGNSPIADLRLMLHATTALGHIIDTNEDAEQGDDGRANWYHEITYTFGLPDGREVSASISRSGRLSAELGAVRPPIPTEVEYLADDPSISRLKGDGSQNINQWLLRTGLGGLLLALLVSPGIKLIRNGVTAFREATGSRDQMKRHHSRAPLPTQGTPERAVTELLGLDSEARREARRKSERELEELRATARGSLGETVGEIDKIRSGLLALPGPPGGRAEALRAIVRADADGLARRIAAADFTRMELARAVRALERLSSENGTILRAKDNAVLSRLFGNDFAETSLAEDDDDDDGFDDWLHGDGG